MNKKDEAILDLFLEVRHAVISLHDVITSRYEHDYELNEIKVELDYALTKYVRDVYSLEGEN